MFFGDQNISALKLFLGIKDKIFFPQHKKDKSTEKPNSEDYKNIFENISRLDSYLIIKKINNEICSEISEKIIIEIKNYKWIESEKAGRNLWEGHKGEYLQLIAAGKQWFNEHWEAFKNENICSKKCNCI